MSALFNVCVPFEVVAAIQRGEGVEQALQDLSITQDVPTRMVTDIARGVVAQVNAMPYSVTLKNLNPSAPAFAPAASQTPTLFGEEIYSAPASPITSPSVKQVETVILTPLTTVNNDKVNFEIYNPVTETTIFFLAKAHCTFDRVTTTYAERVGFHKSEFTFTFQDGKHVPARFAMQSSTLQSLGITEGTVIVAKSLPYDIAITIRDFTMNEEQFTFTSTDTFARLAQVHATTYGYPCSGHVTYTIASWNAGSYDISEDANKGLWGSTLDQLKISEHDLIIVKLKVDKSYMITFTVRDAMNRDEVLEMKNNALVSNLEAKYCEMTGLSANTLRFKIDGCDYESGLCWSVDTIEDVGIYDGAVVNVQPAKQNHTNQNSMYEGGIASGRPHVFIPSRSPTPVKHSRGGGWGDSSINTGFGRSKAGSNFGASDRGGW
ncbi:hypothetical protein LTR56_011377 [Elasticomyces elasticus]|nr:hypothetical protein LTR56_011377 [Elasticomyces elasticus]KAK3660979.1 hypothetical protein LTR22_007807 [Elasticomyces elasticus]KAK4932386.1 hypothetical protein LTR49_001255 [Elasticomyces elasticus]KAK5768394.1 hypothetical protein LTS12_001533 [Elasticomyces elasticus]